MSKSETRKIVDYFLDGLNRAASAETFDSQSEEAFPGLHKDVSFTVAGQMPWGGTHLGIAGIIKAFAPTQGRMSGRVGYGVFPTEFMEDGNKMVVLAKGRGASSLGEAYNNTYFMFFEVGHGKVIRFREETDSSLSWRCVLDTRIEPAD